MVEQIDDKTQRVGTFELTEEQRNALSGKIHWIKVEDGILNVYAKEHGLTEAEKKAREALRQKARNQKVAEYVKQAKALNVRAPQEGEHLGKYDAEVLAPARKALREQDKAKRAAERAKEQMRRNAEKQKQLAERQRQAEERLKAQEAKLAEEKRLLEQKQEELKKQANLA